MKPYRDLFPHAGLMLPETQRVASRVIVLPTGTGLPDGAVQAISDVMRVMVQGGG